MGSRVRIAAAACVIASGLLMGGAHATTASADPEPGSGGDGAPGAASPPPPGVVSRDTDGDTPSVTAASPGAVTAGAPKATPRLGARRDSGASNGSGTGVDHRVASKHPGDVRRSPSQTADAAAGEPIDTPPPTSAVASPTVPDRPAVPATDMKDTWGHLPGFLWPWWGPCPDPDDPDGPGLPPGSGGGGAQPVPPRGRPALPPIVHLPRPREVPPELPNISVDPAIDPATGGVTAGAAFPFAPITLPAVIAPFGAGPVGGSGTGPRAGMPSAPSSPGAPQSGQPAPKPGRQNPPAFSAGSGAPPESFRVGYGNYLRTAGVGQMMAVAIPGVAGILFLTAAGGLLGYRQARAGRAVRASTTARFMG